MLLNILPFELFLENALDLLVYAKTIHTISPMTENFFSIYVSSIYAHKHKNRTSPLPSTQLQIHYAISHS
jgi:hypothetical protein